jgi:hypothetical protein
MVSVFFNISYLLVMKVTYASFSCLFHSYQFCAWYNVMFQWPLSLRSWHRYCPKLSWFRSVTYSVSASLKTRTKISTHPPTSQERHPLKTLWMIRRGLLGAWITTGNPHTTWPLINQSSCTGEYVEIKWSGTSMSLRTQTRDPLILGRMS